MREDDTLKTRNLRSQCHQLLDDQFAGQSNAVRYKWLRKNNVKVHMADMTDVELECLKYELIMMGEVSATEIYKRK